MKKIFVAGHNGMVGRALTRALSQKEDLQLITVERTELDLWVLILGKVELVILKKRRKV